jgi:hypothetical protein
VGGRLDSSNFSFALCLCFGRSGGRSVFGAGIGIGKLDHLIWTGVHGMEWTTGFYGVYNTSTKQRPTIIRASNAVLSVAADLGREIARVNKSTEWIIIDYTLLMVLHVINVNILPCGF